MPHSKPVLNSAITTLKRSLIGLVVLLFTVSCSDSSSGDSASVTPNETNNPNAGNTSWTINEYQYVSESTPDSTRQSVGGVITITELDNDEENSQGAYSGSSLEITLLDAGEGVYTVTDIESVVAARPFSSKLAYIQVSAGTNQNTHSIWDSITDSGFLSVTVDDEGLYTVSTTDPVLLNNVTIDSLGIPDAPFQIESTVNSVGSTGE